MVLKRKEITVPAHYWIFWWKMQCFLLAGHEEVQTLVTENWNMSFSNICNMCQKNSFLMVMQWVNARFYQIFRCCNYAIINLEVPSVKILIFDEQKIVEANIDHVIFQVRFLPDNDGTNTCTFLSLSVINA